MRGAIIGFGNVAAYGHVPGWRGRGDVELVAATDVRAEQRAECATHLPGARWYRSAEALLAEERLDFIDICTPPSSHAHLIHAGLERGLHVLCEKPLVRTLGELASVAARARASQRVLHAVHNWHHAPIVELASRLIADGEIGDVQRVIWHTLRSRPAVAGNGNGQNWRLDPEIAGGGVLSDHGWHVAYLIQRWLGVPPVSVSARLETRRHAAWRVEDTANVFLAFPAATADVFLTWAADERRNWARIEGASGHIELHDDVLVLLGGGTERRWACPPLSNGSHHPEWFGGVVDAFVAEVNGAAAAGGNLAEATLCLVIEALARESSRRGGETMAVPSAAGIGTVPEWP